MATLNTRKSGSRFLQFADPWTKERRTLGIGIMGDKPARAIQVHVEHLVSHKTFGVAVPDATSSWLVSAPAKLMEKLVELKLIAPRASVADVGLKDFCTTYIDGRPELKERSRINLEQVRNSLCEWFGESKTLSSIAPAGAADYRRFLVGKYATATVAMHIKRAKQIFTAAADRGLVTESPFSKVKAGSQVNEERNVYVPAEDIEAVIAECPNAEWKLLFALARYGGLRTPSESRLLKWTDVNWKRGRFTVTSPKTEHHVGKGNRVVPIFPELLPHLREAFEQSEEGAVYVLPTLRGENLATTAQKIIKRAAVTPWPRTWQNLRASRETDLADRFSIKVVCAWIGNSPTTATKHYLQVKESHFETAIGALHPALRHGPEYGGIERKALAKTSEMPANAELGLPLVGVELRPLSLSDLQDSHRAVLFALRAKLRAESRRSRRLHRQSRRDMTHSRRRKGVAHV